MRCVGAGEAGSVAKRARTENTVPGDALQQLADAHNATEQARPLASLPKLTSSTLKRCSGSDESCVVSFSEAGNKCSLQQHPRPA